MHSKKFSRYQKIQKIERFPSTRIRGRNASNCNKSFVYCGNREIFVTGVLLMSDTLLISLLLSKKLRLFFTEIITIIFIIEKTRVSFL